MRCLSLSLVLVTLTCVIFGCSHATAPAPGGPVAEVIETTPPPPEGVTLVKLKLPGMTCGGCAMEVKDTLAKVDGVSHLATDPNKHECTFWYAKADSEIKAKLDELAKSNDKISGYEWLN